MAEYGCPGKQENNLNVKNDKNKSDNVESDIELDPCAAYCFFAALVGRIFCGVGPAWTQETGGEIPSGDENNAKGKESKNIAKITQCLIQVTLF